MLTCISGIDTNIGKTYATGLMARSLLAEGYSVITQKLVQTGCRGLAEDIEVHRRLMGVTLFPEDREGLTCPYVFEKPCSPHLAAELELQVIDPERIRGMSSLLAARYDHVLLEGAGGLMVPLTREMTFLDYVQEQGHPLILVTSPRLGSINHTLSALELIRGRGLELRGLVYNMHGCSDETICRDSRIIFKGALEHYGFRPTIVDMGTVGTSRPEGGGLDCLQLFPRQKTSEKNR